MDSLGGGGLPFAFGIRHPGLGERPFAASPQPRRVAPAKPSAILPQKPAFAMRRRQLSCIRLVFIHRGQSERRMGISRPGPHLGRDPNRLHQFLARGAMTKGCFRVPADTIGALGNMRHRDGNQLLGLDRQSSAGKDLTAKLLEGFFCLGRKGAPFLGEFPRSGWRI